MMPAASAEPRLRDIYLTLGRAETVEALFASACDLGPDACGFARCVIGELRSGSVTAAGSTPVGRPDSDRLRRALAAEAVKLEPGSEEAEHIRRGRRPAKPRPRRPLATHLGLQCHAYGLVAPGQAGLALVIFDRAGPPVTAEDLSRVDTYAALIGVLLERVLQRRRVIEIAQEVRLFAGMATVLSREATSGVPTLGDAGTSSAMLSTYGRSNPAAPGAYARLSEAERPVADGLAGGLSNRQIAAAIAVSPETVKSHVASILRKLGVANRVEAATLLLQDPGR